MPTLMSTRAVEFSCRPAATVPVDGDAADLLDAVLDALEDDPRAIAPAVGYDYDTGQLSATFQIEIFPVPTPGIAEATAAASDILDDALAAAGVTARTSGAAVVEGDDPDQLP